MRVKKRLVSILNIVHRDQGGEENERITPSVQKYLSSKWIKRDVPKTKIRLDASPFIHFDDKYFRTEGVRIYGADSLILLHMYSVSV